MNTDFSKISANFIQNGQVPSKTAEKRQPQTTAQNTVQIASKTSSAVAAYGMAHIKPLSVVSEPPKKTEDSSKTINIFFFSDTHGELNGLTKLGAAKESCAEFCGGEGHLTVLGSGDLIAGCNQSVINATVSVVNQFGMEATSLGNHERSRSDEALSKIADNLKPELLAINANANDKACSVFSSKVCTQNGIDFITVGAKPLSAVESPLDIAKAIDAEVERIKEDRRAKGLSDDLPVVFLSHMGSYADKAVAENSQTVDLILGGHSHNVEEHDFTNASGKTVHVLQSGKNNEYATVVKMDIADDGTVKTTAKLIDIKQNDESICSQMREFYGDAEKEKTALKSAKAAEEDIKKIVEEFVGKRIDLVKIAEGNGFVSLPEANGQIRERNYCNPVANILADAMLETTRSQGVKISFFNAPSVKDTAMPDGLLTNYDIIGRMIPFGETVVTADLPIEKLYEMVETIAQRVTTDGSQLVQVGGMVYSVNADKAEARNHARIAVMQAEKDLKEAQKNNEGIAEAETKLQDAREEYSALPPCVEKMMILDDDGTEIKISPKAIARGDFAGKTIKCAINDYLAGSWKLDFDETGLDMAKIFQKQIQHIKQQNDGEFFVDQNDVRIAVKDKSGKVNGYEPATTINTKYWY